MSQKNVALLWGIVVGVALMYLYRRMQEKGN